MDLQVLRSLVIPPPSVKSEEVPLTVFDLSMPAYHFTILFAFSPPNPTIAALISALTVTLPNFPLLTARLERRRRPLFVTGQGGSGALAVEATVSTSALSDHLPLVPSPDLARLHAPVGRSTPHLFQVQITRFACSGLVIATSVHHHAADGHSLSTFLQAWAAAVHAGDVPALQHPIPYGPAALTPRSPPRCEFDHRAAEFLPLSQPPPPPPPHSGGDDHDDPPEAIANMLLNYTGEFVTKLKASVENRHTTFETVSGHLWRKITAARGGCAAARTTTIDVAVDGRRRLGREAEPVNYFGNLVLSAVSSTAAGELARGSLADAAALVGAGVRAVDGRYFQSFIDFGALHGDEELVPTETNNVQVVEVDSWLRMGFDSLDLGRGGRLVGILPGRIPLDGVVVLIPSVREAEGINVFVALRHKAAQVLKDIAYTVD